MSAEQALAAALFAGVGAYRQAKTRDTEALLGGQPRNERGRFAASAGRPIVRLSGAAPTPAAPRAGMVRSGDTPDPPPAESSDEAMAQTLSDFLGAEYERRFGYPPGGGPEDYGKPGSLVAVC